MDVVEVYCPNNLKILLSYGPVRPPPPTGSRGGSPSNIAPFLGKGVWG